jgi:hypothetical protein
VGGSGRERDVGGEGGDVWTLRGDLVWSKEAAVETIGDWERGYGSRWFSNDTKKGEGEDDEERKERTDLEREG